MNRSSALGYWFLKLVGAMAFIGGLVFLHGVILPDHTVVEGLDRETRDRDWPSLITMVGMMFFIAYYSNFRFSEIEYGDKKICILGSNEEYEWNEIKRVIKIPFCTPPIYRMSFKKSRKPIYLIMSMSNISIGFYSWDFTGFYKLAKDKIS